MSFVCDPKTCKALCCKYDGRGLFTLDLFVNEARLFHPGKTVFILSLINIAKTKEKRTEDYLDAYINTRNVFNDARLPNFYLLFMVQAMIVGEECPYLKENKCSIYRKRPFICAAYPFISNEPGIMEAFKKGDFKAFQESIFRKCGECCPSCGGKFRNIDEFHKERRKVMKKYRQRYRDVFKEHRRFLLKLFRENLDLFLRYINFNLFPASSSPELSALLVRKIYGEKGIEYQIDAIEKALNSQLCDWGDKERLNAYREFLELLI